MRSGAGAEREADAELALLLPHAIGDDAVHADDAEGEAGRGEHRQQHGKQTWPAERAGDQRRSVAAVQRRESLDRRRMPPAGRAAADLRGIAAPSARRTPSET